MNKFVSDGKNSRYRNLLVPMRVITQPPLAKAKNRRNVRKIYGKIIGI